MNHNSPHHWSFDYNYGAQNPQFSEELIETLRACYTSTIDTADAHTITHVYNILPNYWRGYAGGDTQQKLSIGTATVERTRRDDSLWHYAIQYQNTTSGENLKIQFRCRDEEYRPLDGSWHIEDHNSASDEYSRLTCHGAVCSPQLTNPHPPSKADAEIRLSINRTQIVAGTVDRSLKLTCNWALFDIIPELAHTIQEADVELALLEDLEQLRKNSTLGFLESIQTPCPLDGYYLYGTGLLPSYWWLDAHGNIAIFSSTFETWVLKHKSGGTP